MLGTVVMATALVAPIYRKSETVSDSYISRNPVHLDYTPFRTDVDTSSFADLNKITPFDKVIGEMLSYIDLTEDWDGYGAISPDKETIHSALEFLELIRSEYFSAPKPMLSGDGEVSMYWESNGKYIEIGFDRKDQFSYLIDSDDITRGEDDLIVDGSIPSPLLKELIIISKELRA